MVARIEVQERGVEMTDPKNLFESATIYGVARSE